MRRVNFPSVSKNLFSFRIKNFIDGNVKKKEIGIYPINEIRSLYDKKTCRHFLRWSKLFYMFGTSKTRKKFFIR